MNQKVSLWVLSVVVLGGSSLLYAGNSTNLIDNGDLIVTITDDGAPVDLGNDWNFGPGEFVSGDDPITWQDGDLIAVLPGWFWVNLGGENDAAAVNNDSFPGSQETANDDPVIVIRENNESYIATTISSVSLQADAGYALSFDLGFFGQTGDWGRPEQVGNVLVEIVAGEVVTELDTSGLIDPGPNGAMARQTLYFTTGDVTEDLEIRIGSKGGVDGGDRQRLAIDKVSFELHLKPFAPAVEQSVVNDLLEVTLLWNAGQDPDGLLAVNPAIVTQYVYISENQAVEVPDPNLYLAGEAPVVSYADPASSFGPALLDFDGQYDWLVELGMDDGTGVANPAGDPNNIVGPIWSFDTLASVPIITEQPVDQVVELTETAVFMIEVTSISDIAYAWYKTVDNTTETPFDDVLVGQEPTLTLPGTAANEGYYYCKLINESGEENAVYSDVVTLGVKRQWAHWTLDWADFVGGQYLDSSGEGRHADPNIAPDATSFVAGAAPDKTNDALDLTVEPLAAAFLGTESPADFTGEMTISLWVKWAGPTGDWQGIVSKRQDGEGSQWFWQIDPAGNVMNLNQFGVPEAATTPPVQNEWTHLVITVDPVQGGVLYKDGLQAVAEPGFYFGGGVDAMMILGGNVVEAGTIESVFNGVIDDVKVFNYAKDEIWVADTYFEIMEIQVCLNPHGVDLSFDFTGDCRVGLADFAEFAASWLNTGLYPELD